MRVRSVKALVAASSLVSIAGLVNADQIQDFKGNAGDPTQAYGVNGNPPPAPVVTYIISKSATKETFLMQDPTGGLEVYSDTLANNSPSNYAPAVGDTVNISGFSADYYGLYEAENLSKGTGTNTYAAINLVTTQEGTAALPSPDIFTVANMQMGSQVSLAQQSELGSLQPVYFTSNGGSGISNNGTQGAFKSGGTYDVTDGSGLNAVVYVPSGSPLIGVNVPSGFVDIYGYMGEFDYSIGSTVTSNGQDANALAELDGISITAVPEPTSLAGLALGGLALIRRRRHR